MILVYCRGLHASRSKFRLQGIAQLTWPGHRNSDAETQAYGAIFFWYLVDGSSGLVSAFFKSRAGSLHRWDRRRQPTGVHEADLGNLLDVAPQRDRLLLLVSPTHSGGRQDGSLRQDGSYREQGKAIHTP
jgi:hypothetical protein